VYLNREGGTYRPGEDSAIANAISNLPSPGFGDPPSENVVLAAPGIKDGDWTEITDCVRDLLSPYNVSIVEEDPAANGAMVVHHEILMVRYSSDLRYHEGASDFYFNQCELVEDMITPVILEPWPGPRTNREVCEAIVASVGLAAGAEHLADCTSVFAGTFGSSNPCGDRSIANAEVPCGLQIESPGECMCTDGRTLNPHKVLVDTYGAACQE